MCFINRYEIKAKIFSLCKQIKSFQQGLTEILKPFQVCLILDLIDYLDPHNILGTILYPKKIGGILLLLITNE